MERRVLPWRVILCRLHAVRHVRCHLGEVRVQRFTALRLPGVDLAGHCHHAEFLAEQHQVAIHGCRRTPRRTVPFTPAHVVVDQRGEFLFVDVRPTPRDGGHRVAGRPLRQKERRVVALPITTPEPEFRRHTEIPTTTTGVRPPQVTMRVVLFSRRGDRVRLAVLVDHDCFHRVQVIGYPAVQPRQRAETAAGHVPAHTNTGTDTGLATSRPSSYPARGTHDRASPLLPRQMHADRGRSTPNPSGRGQSRTGRRDRRPTPPYSGRHCAPRASSRMQRPRLPHPPPGPCRPRRTRCPVCRQNVGCTRVAANLGKADRRDSLPQSGDLYALNLHGWFRGPKPTGCQPAPQPSIPGAWVISAPGRPRRHLLLCGVGERAVSPSRSSASPYRWW